MYDSVQSQLIAEFSSLSCWEDRYKKIIAMGRELPPLPVELHTDSIKVKGCQSQVWLHGHLDKTHRVQFLADSDALIVKGLIAILLKIYSDQTPQEILKVEPHFIRELGFAENLSPSRTNGLFALVKQIKYYALAFQTVV